MAIGRNLKESFTIICIGDLDTNNMKKQKKINIPIPANFSFQECLHYLDRGFDDCLYHLGNNAVSRLVQLCDGRALINIYEKSNALQIEMLKDSISNDNLVEMKNYVLDWFDIERNIQPFYELLSKNVALKEFPNLYLGARLVGIPNLFEALCWAIIGQQINLTFAYKLKRSLVEKYGEKEVAGNIVYYLFPTPEVLAKLDRNELIKMKFSRQKIDYILNVSHAFLDNQISKAILTDCKTKDKRVEKLTSIKGVGIWTANYVLMKTMRDMSCIAYGDSGLNKALNTIFATDKKPTNEEVDDIFKNFRHWESYLNFYLWRFLTLR